MTPRRCDVAGCDNEAILWNEHNEWSCGKHQLWLARRRSIVWDTERARMAS